jgi:putative ABC transport system ATP-binding protein
MNETRNASRREAIIEIRGLSRVFRRDTFEVPALEDVSLDVAEGEFLALMGPSGSGKSTLLNVIAGIDRATSGSVVVAGTNLTALSEKALTKWRGETVGFVFQFYNLIPVLTAFENVELPLLLTHLSKRERREHVATALRVVGLEDRMHHLPRQLSGGEEQRVGIARAIVVDPRLILADEPTGDLDQRSASEIMALLESLNRDFGKTIVMVTHDPRAAGFAHRLSVLEKGRMLPEGSTLPGMAPVRPQGSARS